MKQAGFDPECIKGLSWIQRQAPGHKTSMIRTLSDSLSSFLSIKSLLLPGTSADKDVEGTLLPASHCQDIL